MEDVTKHLEELQVKVAGVEAVLQSHSRSLGNLTSQVCSDS